MVNEKSTILFNNPLGHGYYHMGLSCSPGYAQAVPGQFVMLGSRKQIAPLLRRPFSIHRLIEPNGKPIGIELLYMVVGTLTRLLARCRPGEHVELLGPLGNGFEVSKRMRTVFLVSGGIGVAPLVFLLSVINKTGAERTRVTTFLGGRSKPDVLCLNHFSDCSASVHITTDDGSLGGQGFITHPLEKALQEQRPDMVYACGPMGMLERVMDITLTQGVSCQVSIETMMACGMGACLGCAVSSPQTPEKYLHACRDGPVFHARKLHARTR